MEEKNIMPVVKEVTIKLSLTQHHIEAIEELAESFKEYVSKIDGRKPFKDCSFEEIFEMIIRSGSYHMIDEWIMRAQYGNKLITIDQLMSGKMKTVAEWEEEAQRQAQYDNVNGYDETVRTSIVDELKRYQKEVISRDKDPAVNTQNKNKDMRQKHHEHTDVQK